MVSRFAIALLVLAIGLLPACPGTTGYEIVTFEAAASGPANAVAGQPYTFSSDFGYTVQLNTAVLHVGAIYLEQSVPSSGAPPLPCTLPGNVVGEVRGLGDGSGAVGLDVNLLSPDPQPIPGGGDGSTIPAATAQVWLTDGDVTSMTDQPPVLTVDGCASKTGAATIHFQASITINEDRFPAPANMALPGENPICFDRIVSPIPADITLAQGGLLLLRIDPARLFTNVDFSGLPDPTADPALFTNDTSNQPSINLFDNLRGASTMVGALYQFEWRPAASL